MLEEVENPRMITDELVGIFRPRDQSRELKIKNWSIWLKGTDGLKDITSVAVGELHGFVGEVDYELMASSQGDICCHDSEEQMLNCATHVLKTGSYINHG